jgi:hypothetical protein
MDPKTQAAYDAVKQKAKKDKKDKKYGKDSPAALGQALGMEGIIGKFKKRQKMLDDI